LLSNHPSRMTPPDTDVRMISAMTIGAALFTP
jgi:hypothetical protein